MGENYSLNLYVGARFPTRALEIKVRSVFQVFFSEIRHTLGSMCYRGGNWVLIRKLEVYFQFSLFFFGLETKFQL